MSLDDSLQEIPSRAPTLCVSGGFWLVPWFSGWVDLFAVSLQGCRLGYMSALEVGARGFPMGARSRATPRLCMPQAALPMVAGLGSPDRSLPPARFEAVDGVSGPVPTPSGAIDRAALLEASHPLRAWHLATVLASPAGADAFLGPFGRTRKLFLPMFS